jgi:hypothetical protein
MRIAAASCLALATWMLAASVQAHEGGTHARGTVKEISSDRLELTTTEGTSVSVALGPETHFMRGHKAIQAADVHPGERAVVHAAMRGGKLEAVAVMVADTPK